MGFIDSSDFDIRYTTLDDIPHLRNWLKIEGMLHWYPPSDDQELENFILVWMGFIRYNAALTATYKNEPVAISTLYLMPYRKVAHHCMFQLIVDPENSRKGVGTCIVKNLNHLAKTQFDQEMIYAEILDESPLIPLLQKFNFKEFARQEKYVKEGILYFPRILMGCEIG